MRKIMLSVLFIWSYFFSEAQSIRLPAEWEPQERVLLSLFGFLRRDTVTYRVIEALQPHVKISLYIWDDSVKFETNRRLSKYKIDTSKIDFHIDPFADFWTRDPILFVKDSGKLKVVCFNYTMFGVYPDLIPGPIPEDIRKTGEYDERFAAHKNLPIIKSDYVFEGGGLESNGNGTFLIIKEMALQRNPGKSIIEIENELKRTVGAKKIIWLKEGLIEDRQFKNMGPFYKNYFGGGANMHIDELCRFVNETTVLLPYIDKAEKNKSPIDSINYDMLEENYRILQNATTSDGKKLTIERLPMPEIELLKFTLPVDSNSYRQLKQHGFNIGDTIHRVPAASYCNYFVSNSVVLAQKYWKPGMPESQRKKDEESVKVLKKLFPGREVIAIYSHSVNRGGGGIHCMTHELPATK